MLREAKTLLRDYFALTYLALLAILGASLVDAVGRDALGSAFAVAVYVSYAAIYLAPVAAASLLVKLALRRATRLASTLAAVIAVLGAAALEIVLYADRALFELYGFHLNGMVWNLVTTRGGVESLDGGTATLLGFAAIALGFLALQIGLYLVARVSPVARSLAALRSRSSLVSAAALLLACGGFERATYAFAYATHTDSVLAAAGVFPLYVPTRARTVTRALGLGGVAATSLYVEPSTGTIRYPLHAIERARHRRYNVVWLVAESLRADALDPEIMPATWAFAQRAQRFRSHYSGGNCTRMGVFSMFYGLYGSYWFPFQDQERGPLLMDVLLDDGYQLDLRTSAKFTYPEFTETVFARVPPELMHERDGESGWQSDELHVGRMIDFMERRDPTRPFMSFLFFESPHARYQFPPESVIREPYLAELNYATLDLERDMPLVRNRYLNAVHHLDQQLARLFAYLDQARLLDSTIVVVTGDHGEEFMEKGRWGHGSGFSEEQTRVPLVLWIPGEKPAVIDRMTSHLDIAPTLLRRLGVTNPQSDYSLGFDLLEGPARSGTVVSGWDELALVLADLKIVLPLGHFDIGLRSHVTTRDDVPVGSPDARFSASRPAVLDLMRDLQRFTGSRG